MKKILLRIYYFGNISSVKKKENYQKIIRDVEWKAIADFIPERSSFLDIGCGAGYAMHCALEEKKCSVHGVDPEPYHHGVGRQWDENGEKEIEKSFNIIKGTGESLPFNNSEFDIVYSSHTLEHVQNEIKFLMEAKRVLKDNGTLIIGMPTATMAWINLITNLLFTTHQRIVNFIFSRSKIINAPHVSFKHVFLPESHSLPEKTILYDLKHYKINTWRKIVMNQFTIMQTILPAFYPYPDYVQLFKLRKRKKSSSSVFFICKKISEVNKNKN